MTRVTGYKCIFQTNQERFKFALTLAGEGAGDADFVVADPDAAETLLDMFDDSREAHFDIEAGELTFTFGELELETEEEEGEEEDDDEAEADETDVAAEEGEEEEKEEEDGETDSAGEESDETTKRAPKQRRRSAA